MVRGTQYAVRGKYRLQEVGDEQQEVDGSTYYGSTYYGYLQADDAEDCEEEDAEQEDVGEGGDGGDDRRDEHLVRVRVTDGLIARLHARQQP